MIKIVNSIEHINDPNSSFLFTLSVKIYSVLFLLESLLATDVEEVRDV